jgi:hypothetical protein
MTRLADLADVEQDGFRLVTADATTEPWRNLERFRNERSPFSRVTGARPLPPEHLLVDSHYGQAYGYSIFEEHAVYGETDELPAFPLDVHANHGFLRVPFRRVARCLVGTRAELEEVLDDARRRHSGELVLRGQSHEHLLGRSEETLVALYADPGALEPSLPPSAGRPGVVSIEAVMPEWCGLVRFYLSALAGAVSSSLSEERREALDRELLQLRASTDSYSLALSLAQHYGLPSAGLDVTDDLDSALFFALSEFDEVGSAPRVLRRRDHRGAPGDEPVLYVFAPFERFRLEYESYRPSLFPRGRPDHQSARFLATGWGLSRNACARNLCIALYLDPDGDFGALPSAAEMFPGPDEDHFGGVLGNVREWDVSPELTAYLDRFYWVTPD